MFVWMWVLCNVRVKYWGMGGGRVCGVVWWDYGYLGRWGLSGVESLGLGEGCYRGGMVVVGCIVGWCGGLLGVRVWFFLVGWVVVLWRFGVGI